MIAEADRTGDGLITFEDFYRVMKKRGDDPLGEFDSDEDEEYWLTIDYKFYDNNELSLYSNSLH